MLHCNFLELLSIKVLQAILRAMTRFPCLGVSAKSVVHDSMEHGEREGLVHETSPGQSEYSIDVI